MPNKILILGGYGGTGKETAYWLLKMTAEHIIVAGRDVQKAKAAAERLQKEFGAERVSACFADAANYQSLITAFNGVKLVIVASTTTEYVKQVAEAAMAAGADYLDYHFEQRVIPVLKNLEPQIRQAGRVFITQAGFHPGLPAALVRYAAAKFDSYDKAVFAMAMKAKFEKSESVYELLDWLNYGLTLIYKNGAWSRGTYRDAVKIDFGPPFRTLPCFPIFMEELRVLPKMLGLKELGMFVSGFNWFVDLFVFPLAMLLFKIKAGLGRGFLARLLVWGANTFIRGGIGLSLVLEADGKKDGADIHLRLSVAHPDPIAFTAIAVVACVLQYLDGTISGDGVHFMGHAAEPARLLEDLEKMGAHIEKISS